MSRLLIVRHGQSEWNAEGRWQGRADPPLTELGRAQARHGAAWIPRCDVVISSSLRRASETAEIICGVAGLGPHVVDDRLVERDAGEWSGLTRPEIEQRYPGYLEAGRRPPTYEDDAAMLARIVPALGDWATRRPGADVAVVGHAGLVYTLEEMLGVRWLRIGNLEGRWFAHDGDGWTIGPRVQLLLDDHERTVPDQL